MTTTDIKAGQTWLMRNGKPQVIERVIEGELYPVKVGNCLSWMANGRYWSDDLDHSKDLIKQMTEN